MTRGKDIGPVAQIRGNIVNGAANLAWERGGGSGQAYFS
jgi:hypothetical protein